jgi:succinate dehydrogenase hydrophobic anchor subunit
VRRLERAFYGPSDWLVSRTSARLRRALAFWLGMLAMVASAAIVLAAPQAWWLAPAFLVPNLALSFWALVAAETPVEGEER